MPEICAGGSCGKTVEPVAIEFDTPQMAGWFVVCPVCHYVFERVDDPSGEYHQ